MPDLIDRGELKNRLKWGWANDKFVLRTIDEMPTIEAEPVKHGRWIPMYELTSEGILPDEPMCYMCDQCNAKRRKRLNYCSVCGAKMYEEADDELQKPD